MCMSAIGRERENMCVCVIFALTRARVQAQTHRHSPPDVVKEAKVDATRQVWLPMPAWSWEWICVSPREEGRVPGSNLQPSRVLHTFPHSMQMLPGKRHMVRKKTR